MKKHITIYIFILLAGQKNVAAQYYGFWARETVSLPITHTFQTEVELQYRRQNNPLMGSSTILDEPLLASMSCWMHYKHTPQVTFSASPFAIFNHSPIVQKNNDISISTQQEIRFSLAVDWKTSLTQKLQLINRTCVEDRHINTTNSNSIRLRHRLGLGYSTSKKTAILFFNELLLNIPGESIRNIFDQDRVALLLKYMANKTIRLETGYVHINRIERLTGIWKQQHNFIVQANISLAALQNRKQ